MRAEGAIHATIETSAATVVGVMGVAVATSAASSTNVVAAVGAVGSASAATAENAASASKQWKSFPLTIMGTSLIRSFRRKHACSILIDISSLGHLALSAAERVNLKNLLLGCQSLN